MGAYARGPAFCWVHLSTRTKWWRATRLTSQPKWQYPAESWPWGAHPGCRLTWGPSCASLVVIRSFDIETDTRQTPCDRHDLARAKLTVPSWKLGIPTYVTTIRPVESHSGARENIIAGPYQAITPHSVCLEIEGGYVGRGVPSPSD